MLNIGDVITVKCVDVDFQGQGVAKHEGYIIFIKDLVYDEEAVIKLEKLNKKFGFGKVIKYLNKTSDRKDYLHELNSLNLYHLSDDAQKRWQEKITKDTFYKTFKEDVLLSYTIDSNNKTFYRNKSVFHIDSKNNYLFFGMYDNTNNIISANNFIIAKKEALQILNKINNAKLEFNKNLKHLVFRTNTIGETLVTIVSKNKNIVRLENLINIIKSFSFVVGITLNISHNDYQILGDKSIVLYGQNKITMNALNVEIPINDLSFFQINDLVYHETLKIINSYTPKNKTVIDAYSGVGTIGFNLYKNAKEVIMIENNEENTKQALAYINTHNINNVNVVQSDVIAGMEKISADILVVDPPRKGLDEAFIKIIKDKNFKSIIYMSCDVKTLVRDLYLLKDNYEITNMHCIKMFPQTTSTETLVILKNKKDK